MAQQSQHDANSIPANTKGIQDQPPTQCWSKVTVNDGNDNGPTKKFRCYEEPHVLSPEKGYGYYALRLGQRLCGGKLEIVRKLGWGEHSSVWLAKVYENLYPAKYVAVKVLTVYATVGNMCDIILERKVMEIINSKNGRGQGGPSHPGFNHCIRFYGSFNEISKYGPHLCLVTEVLGGSMREFKEHVRDVAVARRVMKQTLLALDYLHSECGVVHTDVKPDNTLTYLPNMDNIIDRILKEHPSETYEPQYEPSFSPDLIITVKSQPILLPPSEMDFEDIVIRLADFGHAQKECERVLPIIQPDLLRAPEVILGYPWRTPVDIWSVGCLLFEYLASRPLFNPRKTNLETSEEVHLRQMIEFIGPFPKAFLDQCQRKEEFFDSSGRFRHSDALAGQSIAQRLHLFRNDDTSNSAPAVAFIEHCLTIAPKDRPTAKALLSDKWLETS